MSDGVTLPSRLVVCVFRRVSLPTPADHAERVCGGPGARRGRPLLGRLGHAQAEA